MTKSTSSIIINAEKSSVWDALTKPELVKQWQYGSDLITDWQVGSPIRFRIEWNEDVFEQWGTVLEVTPNEKLKYSLFAPRPDLEDKPENYFTMTYSLEENENGVELTIVQDDPRPVSGQETDDNEAGNAVLESLKSIVERQ